MKAKVTITEHGNAKTKDAETIYETTVIWEKPRPSKTLLIECISKAIRETKVQFRPNVYAITITVETCEEE